MEALWSSTTSMQELVKKRKLASGIVDKQAKRCRLDHPSFGFLKPLSPSDSDSSGSTVVTFTDISGSSDPSSGSASWENIPEQQNLKELADRTPSSLERPQACHASQNLQAREHSAGPNWAGMPHGECERCSLGLCNVACSQGPCKMKGEPERLLGDLSTVASICRQGAAAYQHRQLALSSLGIARQNAAKFTDGEAPDNFRPEALPSVVGNPFPTTGANAVMGFQQQAWIPTSFQPDNCCKGVSRASSVASQSLAPQKGLQSQYGLPVLGQYNRQQQGLPATRVNKQTQPFDAFRASYYSKHYKCIQPIWNAPRPQTLPPVRMAPRTRQQYVQHVGTVLNLHKDTVRFTQHLYARLKVCQTSPPWKSHLLLIGCLWIACKLEESREGLPTAQQLVTLVRPPPGSGSIAASAVNAVEIQVMKMLGWQPLQGWDDLNHCKGIRMS